MKGAGHVAEPDQRICCKFLSERVVVRCKHEPAVQVINQFVKDLSPHHHPAKGTVSYVTKDHITRIT